MKNILGTIRNTLDGQTRRLVILPNIYVLVLLTPGTGVALQVRPEETARQVRTTIHQVLRDLPSQCRLATMLVLVVLVVTLAPVVILALVVTLAPAVILALVVILVPVVILALVAPGVAILVPAVPPVFPRASLENIQVRHRLAAMVTAANLLKCTGGRNTSMSKTRWLRRFWLYSLSRSYQSPFLCSSCLLCLF